MTVSHLTCLDCRTTPSTALPERAGSFGAGPHAFHEGILQNLASTPMVNSPRRIASLLIPLMFLSASACTQTPLKVEGHLVWADDDKPVGGARLPFVPPRSPPDAHALPA